MLPSSLQYNVLDLQSIAKNHSKYVLGLGCRSAQVSVLFYTSSRLFRRLDQNGDKKIDFYEFEDAIREYGVQADAATRKECFDEMDLEGNGVVNFDEFLIALRVSITGEFTL